ncbi:MAG: hypothetical protein QNJ41_06850 [Xenococcaceae cyanobacterium MO_188.B32]|nr:hypothetical protein [Xenococcaceae cyanobacterium MO_188.B32]
MLKKINRIPSKLKREALRIPAWQFLSKRSYQTAIKKYASRLPALASADSVLVDSIRQEGVFVTSLEDLGINSNSLMIDTAEKLLSELKSIPSNGDNSIGWLMSKDMMKEREIFLWGLEEKLLDIVENYLSLPVKYVGMHLRREIANGIMEDVRQWHIDIEDYRRIKIIVYLNDVDQEGGPFEYISKNLTSIASKKLKYNNGFVAERVMETVVSRSKWKSCTGVAGTVIFADTCNIFHRAKAPVQSDRFSLTFGYTSRQPIALYYPLKLSQDQWLAISDRLSERQKDCLLHKQSFL